MAGAISSLKGKSLSRDLFDMDGRECAVIKAEEAELKTIAHKRNHKTLTFPTAMALMSLLSEIISVVVFLIFRNFAISGGLLGIAGVFVGFSLYGMSGRTKAEKNKILDIDDNRLARLRNKVGVLEQKIGSAGESEKDLIAARDFFKTKYESHLVLLNKRF